MGFLFNYQLVFCSDTNCIMLLRDSSVALNYQTVCLALVSKGRIVILPIRRYTQRNLINSSRNQIEFTIFRFRFILIRFLCVYSQFICMQIYIHALSNLYLYCLNDNKVQRRLFNIIQRESTYCYST